MMELENSIAIVKQVIKIGNSTGITITQDDFSGIKKGDTVQGILNLINGIPPGDIEIQKNIVGYKRQYNSIMENVFFELVGDKGHMELVTVENVKNFIKMRQQLNKIIDEVTKDVEKEKQQLEEKIKNLTVSTDEEAEPDCVSVLWFGRQFIKKGCTEQYGTLYSEYTEKFQDEKTINKTINSKTYHKFVDLYPNVDEIIIRAVLDDYQNKNTGSAVRLQNRSRSMLEAITHSQQQSSDTLRVVKR